mmetsp:Transcript_20023/g.34422  ORF Transcript_20023/g.34422 Transcript_20023/m.34422 type:complete len:185 (+) Transcript_20023:339-893(+)|eukprot:CAMPEP_0196662826 /NCGR_PEP_ID=MMETSP1086-20130531/50465_1 /TAXON_ID=77921 /ORGANISM="Cyanoptyche  gloeocystis , Strain SAG4.97" /LENGTH=184 /DNA_ID=CAMNT_0041998413 /DNA_START=327 /DNA_END=881 /DNA_ORIENTATION=+
MAPDARKRKSRVLIGEEAQGLSASLSFRGLQLGERCFVIEDDDDDLYSLQQWYGCNGQQYDSEDDEWRSKRRRLSSQLTAHIRQACSSLLQEVAARLESSAQFSGGPCATSAASDLIPEAASSSSEKVPFASHDGPIRFCIGSCGESPRQPTNARRPPSFRPSRPQRPNAARQFSASSGCRREL